MRRILNQFTKTLRFSGALRLGRDILQETKSAVRGIASFSQKHQPPATSGTASEAVNEHVRQYIDYYLNQGPPVDYALLIKGAWGVGKTFLVKRTLERHFNTQLDKSDEEVKYCYVSLYGIADQKQLNMAIARAAYPILDTSAAKGLSVFGKWTANVFKFPISEEIVDLVANAVKTEVFVFDDFERSSLPPKDCLGLLNRLVEHSGKKVIILADETKLEKDADYRSQKEKVIGKTLEVQLDFDPAFEQFVANLSDDGVKQFLLQEREDIKKIYLQSEAKNLRLLRQSLRGFERVYTSISPEYRQRGDIVKAILELYLAFSQELIEQRITAEDLGKRSERIYGAPFQKGDNEKGIGASQKRYPQQDLSDTVLTDGTLLDLLDKGIVRPEAIIADIANSRFFASSIEPWRALWHALEIDDEYLEAALEKFEEQFRKREFRDVGLILHAFGIKLYLAAEGILSVPDPQVVAECSKYIDDVTANDVFNIDSFSEFESMRMGAAYGLGYHKHDAAEFKALFNELRVKTKDAIVRKYPEIAEQVVNEMKEDPSSLSGNIAWTKAKQGKYTEFPVLTGIPAEVFGEAVVGLPGHTHRDVFATLGLRYEGMKLKGVLADELPWLRSLQAYFLGGTTQMKPFQASRIRRFVEWYLIPLTKDEDVAGAN